MVPEISTKIWVALFRCYRLYIEPKFKAKWCSEILSHKSLSQAQTKTEVEAHFNLPHTSMKNCEELFCFLSHVQDSSQGKETKTHVVSAYRTAARNP
jgi:hypothetical protein